MSNESEMLQKCANLAWDISKCYKTNGYTQEDLSKKFKIPLKSIGNVTKAFGYNHTKIGRKEAMRRTGEFPYLAPHVK